MSEKTIETEASRRRDRNVRQVVELLERRAELRGVHPMADHMAESLSWTV
jgi:hypothetical protein